MDNLWQMFVSFFVTVFGLAMAANYKRNSQDQIRNLEKYIRGAIQQLKRKQI